MTTITKSLDPSYPRIDSSSLLFFDPRVAPDLVHLNDAKLPPLPSEGDFRVILERVYSQYDPYITLPIYRADVENVEYYLSTTCDLPVMYPVGVISIDAPSILDITDGMVVDAVKYAESVLRDEVTKIMDLMNDRVFDLNIGDDSIEFYPSLLGNEDYWQYVIESAVQLDPDVDVDSVEAQLKQFIQ